MKHKHLITFGSVMVVARALGTFLLIYFWPHLVNNGMVSQHRFESRFTPCKVEVASHPLIPRTSLEQGTGTTLVR